MNKFNVVDVLRSDARVRPSDAGRDLGKHFFDAKMLDGPLEVDLRDVHPSVLISAFFINFMEGLNDAGGLDAVKKAAENIKWVCRYDFQSSNIDRWFAPYREKLADAGEETVTNALSLADRLMTCQEEHDDLMREFRRCPVWKAIQKYIEDANNEECGIVNKHDGLIHHRGTGAFSLRKVYAYPPGAEEPRNSVRFVFDVSCWDEEYDREVDADVMLDVPLMFVGEFDQALFDEWVSKKSEERKQKNLDSAREKLTALLKKYPELKEEI